MIGPTPPAAKTFLPAAFNAKAERAEIRFAASIAAGASTSQGGMDKGRGKNESNGRFRK